MDWSNCYSGQYDLWAPESYAHPAKMSPALAFRILEHLAELGLLRPGQTVLDPMCGTGTTLLAAAVKGHPAVGCELEPRFVALAQANADRITLKGFGAPIRIIQGDARNLSTLLQERGLVAVSSPPYGEMDRQVSGETPEEKIARLRAEGKEREANVIAVHGRGQSGDLRSRGYGTTPGQIGSLPDRPVAITSPPYAEAQSGGGISAAMRGTGHYNVTTKLPGGVYQPAEHGTSEGQIGNLPDRPVAITSPPYEDSGLTQDKAFIAKIERDKRQGSRFQGGSDGTYGEAAGQLGQEHGTTYLSAMSVVYAEIAKVADVLAIVLKNPTRKGKLRDLSGDTIVVLEATGWQIHCHHHATLFEEQTQGDMFNGPQKKVKGRISFFKRLSWAKGSPVAQWEDVIVAVRRG